jgi:hypothetical protein
MCVDGCWPCYSNMGLKPQVPIICDVVLLL